MKVNEFAELAGMAPSKVRYYDRQGLIRSERSGNNYRNFTSSDALDIYHAQMLRSFDMTIQETLEAQKRDLGQIDGWLEGRIENLEEALRWEEMKLIRLQEMREYFRLIKEGDSRIVPRELDDQYSVWNFGTEDQKLTEPQKEALQVLAETMPFSYIAIKITGESMIRGTEELDICIGLGILKRNQQKIGLELTEAFELIEGGVHKGLFLAAEDPFVITRTDILPLIEEMEKCGVLGNDLTGRIYISYMENDKFVHGIGLGFPVQSDAR